MNEIRPASDHIVGSPDREGLTEDRIIAAALAQIDQRSAANFSLRDLAKTLGVYPTAIYWHVKGRDAILAKVVHYAFRDVALPVPTSDWKGWLREFFTLYRRTVMKHPNIAPLIGAQLLAHGGIRSDMIEGILNNLIVAGFSDDRLVEAYNVVVVAMLGFVAQEFAPLPTESPDRWAEAQRQRVVNLDVLAHPTLASTLPRMANKAFIVRWTNGTDVPLDTSFELFIDVVTLGLERKLKG